MPPPRLRSTLFPYTTLFRSGLRPAGRGVLPVLLASVGQDVDEGERVTELLGAAAVRVPGAVDGVPGAQEHVQGEAAAGWSAHVGPERAAGGGVPVHLVADLRAVGQSLLDRARGDDH